MINGIIRSIFEGYRPYALDKKRNWEYEDLNSTPFLHGSDHLWRKYHEAESEEEVLAVIRHMRRHHTDGIESYDKVWGASWDKLKKMEER